MTVHHKRVVIGGRRRGGPLAVVISLAMEERKIEGDLRDYVLLDDEGTLTTHLKEYVVKRDDTGEVVDVRPPELTGAKTLVHRRNLWKYLGPAQSQRFWRHGRRTRT